MIRIKNNLVCFYGKWNETLRKGISNRKAIVVSLVLHLMIGVAMATFWVNTVYVKPAMRDRTIEFDLTPTRKESPTKNLAKAASQKSARGSQGSKAARKAGGAKASRERVVMASLAGLSQMKASFNFIQNSVASADSSSAFHPMSSNGPEVELNSIIQKYKDGQGKGGVSIGVGTGCAVMPRK